MAALRLNQARVDALDPHKSAYDVRDRDLKGFGVRVLPSGAKRYFINSQHKGRRVWKIVGRDGAIGAEGARNRARTLLASIRKGNGDVALPDTPLETVADEVFRRYARNWKPSTRKVNQYYYRNQILPWFGGRPIGDIDARDLRQWFASLNETPAAADRSAPILSVVMRQAEVYGYRPEGSNPCTGIRRYRRQGRERFLSTAEVSRLGEKLRRHEADHSQAVAIIRLLLLTGCRKGEIVTLKWRFYRDGKLFLSDSKVGPRTVWLSSTARAILDGLPRKTVWVFPSPQRDSHLTAAAVDPIRNRVRAEADLSDVRLHDLRHTHASMALAQGETVLTIGRLLGHRNPATTLKYIHLSDAMVREAVATVGAALEGQAMTAERRRLTVANVAKLARSARGYTVWDTRQTGLGVRIRTSGHRSFVYWRKGEDGARRITLGSAALMSVEEARSQCLAIETGAQSGQTQRVKVPTFGGFVAGPGRACFDRGKPSTRKTSARIVSARLLPTFDSSLLNRITRADVTRWFDECSRTMPGAANKALSLLSRILDHAIVCGHLQTNPARGIKWNPGAKLTRFLSREEVRRLHRVLDRHAVARPSCARQADVIRLLLLTGCRKSETLTLRWQDVDADTLNLTDTKTGPRRVFLNAPARAILERQPRSDSAYVLPATSNSGRPLSHHLPLWRSVRREAGIEDVRLHDLRHTFASHAILKGVPLPVVSRLLGHKRPSMTLRYAHVGDREIEAAAERIGVSIARALDDRWASSCD